MRGKTLSIGIRTGLILPERFEIAMCVRFEFVDGMMKCFVYTVRWNDDFCDCRLVFITDVLKMIPMRFVVTGQAAQKSFFMMTAAL